MNISVCKTRSHLERGVFFVHLWTKGVWGESPASTFLHSFAEQKGGRKGANLYKFALLAMLVKD